MTPNQQGTEHSAGLALLLFRIFVYVTDLDRAITPYDVQRFQRLVANTTWTVNAELRKALAQVRANYSDFWAAYERQASSISLVSIAEQLNSAWFASYEYQAELRESLKDYVQKIGQTSSPVLARLGRAGMTLSKVRARSEVEELLEPRTTPISAGSANASRVAESEPPPAAALWPAAALDIDTRFAWRRGRTRVVCVHVSRETHDVATFTFVARPACLFSYRPGQFVTLDLPINGATVRRSYTLSSSPSRPWALCITVKRVPDGRGSSWLHEHLKEGVELDLTGPHGRFTCHAHPQEKLLLISGGSGVTPMMSMLRWLSDTASRADTVFLNNVRTPSDIVFERELMEISARMGARLKLGVVPGVQLSGQSWNGLIGPMSDQLLQRFAPDFLEREVFVCGPVGYMAMVRNMLCALEFPMNRYHEESFGGPAPVAPAAASGLVPPAPQPVLPRVQEQLAPIASAAAPFGGVTVIFEKSGREMTCGSSEFILDVAERNGIEMMSACRSGVCGTCRVRCIAGAVGMDGQTALSEAEVSDGFILACVSRPLGRVVLEA